MAADHERLDVCRARAVSDPTRAHAEVESILAPLTTTE
jgi:hypothetical protein